MKKFIKSLIPPILLRFIQRIHWKIITYFYNIPPEYSAKISYQYNDFTETYDSLWDSPNWVLYERNKLKKFDNKPNIHHKSVISICNVLNKLSGFKKIHVIDFGGGGGTLAQYLFNSPLMENIEFQVSVIDSPSIIKYGEDTFSDSTNIRFFEQESADINRIKQFSSKNFATILNISSVIQYIPNYKEFLSNLLEQTKPLVVTITRFPRCENANADAFAVQNVTTPLGFCGSTIVNLFGKDSLTDCMRNLGYNVLFEDFNEINDTVYFDKCDDEQYRYMTLVAYTFVKNLDN